MGLNKTCKCGAVIPYGEVMCGGCRGTKRAAAAEYDKSKRDKRAKAFYNSKEWARIRKVVIAKYNGLCVYSLMVDKRIVPADVVHHIVELRDDWGARINMSNLIPLNNSVHSAIHMSYGKSEQDLLKRLLREWGETL